MWVRLLKDLHYEGDRVVRAGTVLWVRRVGVARKDGDCYRQDHSALSVELDELIMVLPTNVLEGDLYEVTDLNWPDPYAPEDPYVP